MRIRLSILVLFLFIAAAAHSETEMSVGDGMIDGDRLNPYELSWQQCVLDEGEWRNRGVLTEQLVAIGELVFRHRQTALQPSGATSRSDTYFDRASFAPLRMEMEVTLEGNQLAYLERELDSEGYTGTAVQGDSIQQLEGAVSSEMLHGGAMGLPLAAMEYQDKPVVFLASMISFDGTYDVIAEWVGKETGEFNGEEFEAWLIDVEWHHRESGDIYAPGPDASGGRYWVVRNPPDGYPYVPRYQTDTYAVEFAQSVCPDKD